MKQIGIKMEMNRREWIYLIKCVVSAMLCYSFFFVVPELPIYWALISTVIVLSPDNDNQLAYTRIKSNVLGGLVGLLLYAIPLPNMLIVALGITLTILIGYFLQIQNTVRSGMAAVIIVLVETKDVKDWSVPVDRIICVFIGCLVSLFVTYIFSFFQNTVSTENVEKV